MLSVGFGDRIGGVEERYIVVVRYQPDWPETFRLLSSWIR